MAQMILTSVGQSVGGPIGAFIGSTIGRAIDQRVISSLEPARQKGPRLETLKVQGTAEGAPMACVFGRARVTGQVIWAARFREGRKTSSAGKGGPRVVEYDYSLSFAVALCEGEIDGVGRVWADGRPMELAGVTMRVHRGGADQTPDPLIEAVEGAAPAYRGCAYVVFEDLPLGPFGNRAPQLAFEVFRRARGDAPRLEDQLEGVCLIPGAGEFVLATTPVMRREGLTRSTPENLHMGAGGTDLEASLDQLMAQAPNLKRVSLVVGWFGTDLRAGHCVVKPGVERRMKPTRPLNWSVAGLGRGEAHLISDAGDGPAYGGTPSDESVKQAVAALAGVGAERLTVAVGPLEALRLEPADAVEVEGRDGVWRVARVDLDETPSVLLEPVLSMRIGEDDDGPRPDEAAGAVGAPFLRIRELPPLPGAETDERPFVVPAAEPWRAMRVFAGADETALTARADVAQPADVGELVEPLGAGLPYRWDETNALVVRVEGRAPESRSVAAVLGGANTVAVETVQGWELVQFREAVLVGDDVWRLSGLLRGQQGTEGGIGAEAGAVCVFIGSDLARAASPSAERGLPLLWRAGPLGGPAGGAETAEVVHAVSGVAARPWRPVHLSVENEGEGRRVFWRARSRIDGDRWDGEAAGADPLRFRVRVMAGETVMREVEVEGLEWLYPAVDLAADFSGGPGADASVEVAQWGEGHGWGVVATTPLT